MFQGSGCCPSSADKNGDGKHIFIKKQKEIFAQTTSELDSVTTVSIKKVGVTRQTQRKQEVNMPC